MNPHAIPLDSHVEPLVDDALIQTIQNLSLKVHEPVKHEIVFTFDRPWENNGAGFCTFLRAEDGRIRLYYRAAAAGGDLSDQQTTALAFSDDGVHFERPACGLIESEGSKENNLIWKGIESHNMAPFRDENPTCDPECRYKAIGGPMWIYGLCSADGIRWRKIQEAPLEHEGVFDSHNVTFWDSTTGCYRSFSRYFDGGWPKGIRAIQSATSDDFIHWSKPVPHVYTPGVPLEHFYTNATLRYPGHPNLLLSFPMRFIFERKVVNQHPHKGVSDTVFMTSRDGVHWDRRFAEAWVRPGIDPLNWTDRSNMTSLGLLELSPDEWTMYISEHYRCAEPRLRRMTVRPHGFASVHAGYWGGEFTTHPVVFKKNRLQLNASTSAAGQMQVEIQTPDGRPIPGFTLDDMAPMYGDRLDHTAIWKNGPDLSAVMGQSVCFRFVMRDADLFSLRIV